MGIAHQFDIINVGNAYPMCIILDSSLRWNDKVGAVIPVKTGIQKTL